MVEEKNKQKLISNNQVGESFAVYKEISMKQHLQMLMGGPIEINGR